MGCETQDGGPAWTENQVQTLSTSSEWANIPAVETPIEVFAGALLRIFRSRRPLYVSADKMYVRAASTASR